VVFEWSPVEADPRKRHLAMVQGVFERYHDHTRRFLATLDSEGSVQPKRTLERLIIAAERLLGSFAGVIAMLKSWDTADGLEAIRLAVVLELVTAVDKQNRKIIARAKVLVGDAEDDPPPPALGVGEELQTLTARLLEREESYLGGRPRDSEPEHRMYPMLVEGEPKSWRGGDGRQRPAMIFSAAAARW
jgi:hypothetical protein